MTNLISREKIKIGLLGLLTGAAFWPTFLWMVNRFSREDSFYAHGFLIPFIVAYLVYLKREEFSRLEIRPVRRAVFILLGFLVLHLLAVCFEINFLSGLCFIGVLASLILYNCGVSFLRSCSFALFFLIFMVPLPKVATLGIAFHLKIMVAYVAGLIMRHFVPLKVAGSMINLPDGVMAVGAPCSGLKSLISLSALSILFGYLSGFRRLRLWVFFLCSIPIAIASNILRIMLLIFVFYAYGSDVAMNRFHEPSGFLVFVIAFFGLVLLKKVMLKWKRKN